jgi:hypothetical protein
MRCEFVNERTQVNVEVRVMPLYWLVYRHNNQISVVIEPGAERGWPVQRTSMLI